MQGIIDQYPTEGNCDFTTELRDWLRLELDFDSEKATKIMRTIAYDVAEDIKKELENFENFEVVRVAPFTYPQPEVVIQPKQPF